MRPTAFHEPAHVADACALLMADPWGSKAISGGTAVVLMLRSGLIAPGSFVSLARISDLRGISVEDGVLRIGAGTTLAEVAAHPAVRGHAPSVAEACQLVGNPRIRNVATIGGNLAEADYASDPPAALASLGARCAVTGTRGRRTVDVIELITGFYETQLEHDELITHVDIPIPAGARGAVYLKYRSRSSEDRACVGVAARADFREGVVDGLEVVVAAVASTLQRVPEALSPVVGTRLEPSVVRAVARSYAESIEPMEDARGSAWYRRKMIQVFVRRALEHVAGEQQNGAGARG